MSPPPDERRRRLLFSLGAGGAGIATAVVAASPVAVIAPAQSAPVAPAAGGYHETAHVRDYYRTARI